MNIEEILNYAYDPEIILGVSANATDAEVEQAWRRSGSPADGAVAEAYRMLKDEESRMRTSLLAVRPYSAASDARKTLKKYPVFVGPGAWYGVIERKFQS